MASAGFSCGWAKRAAQQLQSAGRGHRMAYTSPNFSTICAVVLQGLAVAVMPMICVKPGMRVLTEQDGFPKLGAFDIGLMKKPGKLSPAAEALAQTVRDGLGGNRKLQAAE